MTNPTTSAAVDPKLIRLGATFDNKDAAIHTAIQLLIDAGVVTPEYEADVQAREQVTSSYIGNHVAIPHGLDVTRSHILTSAISFVQVPDGVRFGDDVAYLVIGIAGKDGEHQSLLAALASVLIDEDNIEALRRAGDASQINEILGGIE